MNDKPVISQATGIPAHRYKQHDLDVMRQALAKIAEALPLVESADVGMGDIPAGIAAHEGQNAPHLISVAVDYLERAHSTLKAAINAR